MSRVSGVAELVRAMLLRGELEPGRRVVELPLAERLDVGRSTLREALRKLEGEGLLVANHAGGMRVIVVDADSLADTLRLRAELEALAAGLAAHRVAQDEAPPDALRDLHALAAAAEAATRRGSAAAVLADRHLHRAVCALAESQPCRDALERVWDRLLIASANAVAGTEHIAAAGGEHGALLTAIAAGDAEDASAIARRHVLAALG